jgi:hypothetical protein
MGGAEETTKEVDRFAGRSVHLQRPFGGGAGNGCMEYARLDFNPCDRFASSSLSREKLYPVF